MSCHIILEQKIIVCNAEDTGLPRKIKIFQNAGLSDSHLRVFKELVN